MLYYYDIMISIIIIIHIYIYIYIYIYIGGSARYEMDYPLYGIWGLDYKFTNYNFTKPLSCQDNIEFHTSDKI